MTEVKVKIKEALTAAWAPSCQNTVSVCQSNSLALKKQDIGTRMKKKMYRNFVACTGFLQIYDVNTDKDVTWGIK